MLSDDPNIHDQFDVLQCLTSAVVLHRNELEAAQPKGSLYAIAWLARNLLELAVWSEYCGQSKENAKEFLLDAARDSFDALKKEHPLRKELKGKAKEDGFDIEKKYIRVDMAAEKTTIKDDFKHFNKQLSKWAHPTAFAVMSSKETEEDLRGTFFLGNCYG